MSGTGTSSYGKENQSPQTPTRSSNSSSPKRALKPVSPNKPNSVGKLSFLQSDNIDEHFNCIHTTHNDIIQQLGTLETTTAQTKVDLGQLVDRLKNNNHHLNKLLENIAAYSDEVVTEGNATKNDITNIMTRLDDFNKSLTNLTSKEGLDTKLLTLAEEIKDSLDNIKNDELEELLDKKLSKIQVSSSDDIINRTTAELQKIGIDQEKLDKYLFSKDTVKLIIDPILKKMSDSKSITDPIIDQIQNTSLKPDQITKPILSKLSDLSESTSQDRIIALLNLVEQQSGKISQLSKSVKQNDENMELELKFESLQQKYNSLESKYESLCKNYENKYNDLKNLQNQYQSLSENSNALTKKLSSVANTDSESLENPLSKLSKVKQLHHYKMDNIPYLPQSESQITSPRKRVMSSPVSKQQNSRNSFVNDLTEIRSNNSDDELF